MDREMRRVVTDGAQEGVWLVAGTVMVGYVTWRKGSYPRNEVVVPSVTLPHSLCVPRRN